MTELEITMVIGITSFYALYKLIIYTETQWKKTTSDASEKYIVTTDNKQYMELEKTISIYLSWIVIFSLIIYTFIGYYNKICEHQNHTN
ncbi:MAG: hypothetical protein ACPG19_06070 [Saprospiraceae bacterium]